MSRTLILGSSPDALAAAIRLARAGKSVLVLEEAAQAGGVLREEEFSPGYRAGVMAPWRFDAGLGRDLPAAAGAARVLSWDGDDGWLELSADPGTSTDSIRRYSQKDAGAWQAFASRIGRLGAFLEAMNVRTPPRPSVPTGADLLTLLGLGWKLRGLGRRDMIELLRVLPMSAAELLDDSFENDLLKGTVGAAGVINLHQGPRAAGTGFVMLHHHSGLPAGVFRSPGIPAAGGLVRRLVETAQAAGVAVRTGVEFDSIAVEHGIARGVVLSTGETIEAETVVSALDPRRTMLGLVDPVQLDPDFLLAATHVRSRGVRAQVNLALERLPRIRGVDPGRLPGAVLSWTPGLDYIEKAYDDLKYGRISSAPWFEATLPSLADPGLAPGGRHVMTVAVQYAPCRLRDGTWDSPARQGLMELVLAVLNRFCEDLPVVAGEVWTPTDLEQRWGMPEGNPYHVELGLDQILFMRPFPGYGQYRSPVRGLFLTGPGTHPGGCVLGRSGSLAAGAVLSSRPGEVPA